MLAYSLLTIAITFLLMVAWDWWKGRHARASYKAWLEDTELRIFNPAAWNKRHQIPKYGYRKLMNARYGKLAQNPSDGNIDSESEKP